MNKLILISSVGIVYAGLSMAEAIAPPSGPYRSMDNNESTFNQAGRDYKDVVNDIDRSSNIQKSNNAQWGSPEVPEWVKKRQLDMSNWSKQQDSQETLQRREQYNCQSASIPNCNQQAMQQWNQRRMTPMNPPPQQVNPQFSQPHMNRMKQYFPASRGPVYGPIAPPQAGYNYPNYQNTPPVRMYPPAWR